MANKAQNAKQAISNAKKAVAPKVDAPKKEAPKAEVHALLGKVCKVVKGNKHKDETVKVYFVTKGNQFRKPLALCEGSETLVLGSAPIFMNPDNLEIVGDMSAEDTKRLDKYQSDQKTETLYVAATATHEGDKAVQLSYPGWFKRVFFAKATDTNEGMITHTGYQTSEGTDIFEIAAWKVKKECGMDSYMALKAKQAELAAIVEAK